jgi:hypothetical protein
MAGFLTAPSAHADVISIGLALNGGAITTEASGSGSAVFAGAFGSYSVNAISGVGNPPLTGSSLLNSNSLDVAAGVTSDVLDVYVTESNITSFTGLTDFISSFTENSLSGPWSVTESTYLDTGNGIYALTSLLGSATFTSGPLTSVESLTTDAGAGPYSITALYVITPNGHAGSANSTINVSVPEPATLALFAAGLLGCAIGLSRWRRRPTSED